MKYNSKLTLGLSAPQFAATATLFLRPVVRMMLHFRITYPQLTEMLKALYIDVAVADSSHGTQHQSNSRINLLTGIYRKDVKRVRNQSKHDSGGSEFEPLKSSLGTNIIQKWRNPKGCQDINGKPLTLLLRTDDSGDLRFEELVTSVAKQDIRPKVILEE
jgi:hypothetical protein